MWGVLPVIMKASLTAFSGSLITSVRLVGSFLILFTYVVLAKRAPSFRNFPRVAVLGGIAMTSNYLLFIYGLERTSAISAEIIVQIAIVMMIVAGVLLFKERMTLSKGIGTGLAMMGVYLIIWNGSDIITILSQSNFTGNMMIVAAAVAWPLYGYSQVTLNKTQTSSQALSLILLPAALASLIALPSFEASPTSPMDVPLLLLLIILAVIPYALLASSFKHLESSTVMVIITLSAVVTPLSVYVVRWLGAQFLVGETITPYTIIGGALILVGVFLAVKNPK
jgi:drug/metabolite transporter (DMT)-like permease